jgi:hypothetical protein
MTQACPRHRPALQSPGNSPPVVRHRVPIAQDFCSSLTRDASSKINSPTAENLLLRKAIPPSGAESCPSRTQARYSTVTPGNHLSLSAAACRPCSYDIPPPGSFMRTTRPGLTLMNPISARTGFSHATKRLFCSGLHGHFRTSLSRIEFCR